MTAKQTIFRSRRNYNQWVANETLEDFALRFTAKRARRWTGARVVSTALGTVSFLALEAIGGAITLNYGFTNAIWAIIVVCSLIFVSGIPICYYASRYGVDIDLLTRGAGFGYIGSTICSLIYASFTFIFFALEAAIMSMALELLFDIPLSIAYVISAVVVIPLVTHGFAIISRFQIWTQPLWLMLQVLPFVFVAYHHGDTINNWLAFEPDENSNGGFNLLLFGAASAVVFPLMAQIGEQVDFLRFLPEKNQQRKRWWAALIFAGPGWVFFGVVKLIAGSFLAVLALQYGVAPLLASDPTHMYTVVFGFITENGQLAILMTGVFVIISQLKINVTNAYAGSIAWSNFFSRLTHHHPGRVVWLFFNVAIALALMELGIYQAFENILNIYAVVVVAWISSLVADLVINKPLGLSPKHIEFKRSHLFDINPVGVGSMILASVVGIASHMGAFGETCQAVSTFVAFFLPFLLVPLFALLTKSRYYLSRSEPNEFLATDKEHKCSICENKFDGEDMAYCPAYAGNICSLCCSLDSRCQNYCRPKANISAQLYTVMDKIVPTRLIKGMGSDTSHFLWVFLGNSVLIALILGLVYFQSALNANEDLPIVENALLQLFFLLQIASGVLIWLYVLAQKSHDTALEESQQQTELLVKEIEAHEETSKELQLAKEAAESANQAKSRYLSGVSHELRTPLNTVLGYAQLLEKNNRIDQKTRSSATVIRRSGEHLTNVIESLLEISKIEAGRLTLHRDQVRLPMLLDQIVGMFQPQANEKGLDFTYTFSTIPEYVATDEKRLQQILINLLSNAIKFTAKGKISFTVTFRNEIARFTVSDTGIGISESEQQHVFEPFERSNNEKISSIPGTGLGLSITQLLTELMGGDIQVNSELGKGSEFTITLMLNSLNTPTATVIEKEITGYAGRAQNILVVDDDENHRNLVTDILGPIGFNVTQAQDAESCLQAVAKKEFDLFLLDVSMPQTDGWHLASQLRSQGIMRPIIMVSANPREDQWASVYDDYIVKPINVTTLLEKIGYALKLNWHHKGKEQGKEERKGEGIAYDAAANTANESNATDEDVEVIGNLTKLKAMAQIGYLSGVNTELFELNQANPDSPKWLKQLDELAERCELEALVNKIDELESQWTP